jgi:hypothetical protein
LSNYTVFFGGHDLYYTSANPRRAQSLEALIAEVSGQGFAPNAWVAEVPTEKWAGKKAASVLYAESLAAGRLIEKVGDKYVARGVESKAQTCDDILRSMGYARVAPVFFGMDFGEAVREPLDWATTKPFDNFPGFTVRSSSEEETRPLSIFPAVDIHPVSPVIFDGAGRAVKVK